jgi:hypothetical protein
MKLPTCNTSLPESILNNEDFYPYLSTASAQSVEHISLHLSLRTNVHHSITIKGRSPKTFWQHALWTLNLYTYCLAGKAALQTV